jgi:hypothetical protein
LHAGDRTVGVNVLGDLVARDRRTDAVALRTASRAGSYSYETFCTTAWKAGNLLRHYGVRSDATVTIDARDALAPPSLVAFFGSALLGATATFDADPDERVRARALVAPANRVDTYETAPGTQVLAYGDEHDDPEIAAFEREVWSENPVAPPESVAADADALVADGERFSHDRLLAATRRVASDAGLGGGDAVAPRESLSDPGVVVAGVLAPLSVGATVRLDAAATGDVGVGGDVPESRGIDPAGVFG